jgi:hypothetical protein
MKPGFAAGSGSVPHYRLRIQAAAKAKADRR